MKWLQISGFSIPCTAGTHMLVCAATPCELLEDQLGVGQLQFILGLSDCEESLREVWQFFLFGLDHSCRTTICRSRRGRATLRCWKCSKKSWERHIFTSSIISCAMLETMLTATDSTQRCDCMSWQYTVIHRGTRLKRYFFGLQGTRSGCKILQRVTKHHQGSLRE